MGPWILTGMSTQPPVKAVVTVTVDGTRSKTVVIDI